MGQTFKLQVASPGGGRFPLPKTPIGRILSHKDLCRRQYPESNFVEVYQLILLGFTSLAGGGF